MMEDIFPDEVRILTGKPTIALIAKQSIDWDGVREMAKWVKEHRPGCLPAGYDPEAPDEAETYPPELHLPPEMALFPHGGLRDPGGDPLDPNNRLSDNELLSELAGRKCYDSFGNAAGRRTNAEYMANIMGGIDKLPEEVASELIQREMRSGDSAPLVSRLQRAFAQAIREERDRVPHASVLYHAKMTFFFAGLSRRVSQELMRNYVGSDRDHEGSPSQESTRFTFHYGTFVAPPYVVDKPDALAAFRASCEDGYGNYKAFIAREIEEFERWNHRAPKGMERKRILEASIGVMPWSFETSFIWTTNPGALTKMLIERDNPVADAEFARFAQALKQVCVAHAPNLFPRFVAEMRGPRS